MIVNCYSIFTVLSLCACDCIHLPNFIQIKPPRRSDGVISIFKMVAMASQIYDRLPVQRRHSFEVKICLHTKFWWDILIHGWVITTSGFSKQYGRHIRILFPICNLIIYVTLAYHLHNVTMFRRQFYAKVISIYLKSNVASAAILNLQYSVVIHKASFVGGQKTCRKFCVNRLTSLRDVSIFLYVVYAWKCLFPPSLGAFWKFDPLSIVDIVETPKLRHTRVRKQVFCAYIDRPDRQKNATRTRGSKSAFILRLMLWYLDMSLLKQMTDANVIHVQ